MVTADMKQGRTRVFLIGTLACLAVVGCIGVLVAHRSTPAHAATTDPMTTVTATQLAAADLSLSSLTTSSGSYPVTSAQAASAAKAWVGNGASVLETHLLDCKRTDITWDQPCWVVSMKPTPITSWAPEAAQTLTPAYDLVLVDPTTGSVISEAGGSTK